MCVVSMVGDHYRDKWQDQWLNPNRIIPGPSQQDFDALKKEVQDLKELLKRAKKYDRDNGEPDCEVDEKMDLLRKVAQKVGVNLEI